MASRTSHLLLIAAFLASLAAGEPPATSPSAGESAARSEWLRVQAQVQKADSLPSIVALHEKFLARYPDTAAARDAGDSLAAYRKLAAAGASRFQGKWMTPADIAAIQKAWSDAARPAMDLYAHGRTGEALDAARQAVAADPRNPHALMAAGLAAFRLQDADQAGRYFKQAASLESIGCEAENNLGVIAFLQGAQGDAIAHYLAALRLNSRNRALLDNLTELVLQYKGKVSPQYASQFQVLLDMYQRAEEKLEADMARKGLTRFGSTWVDREQLDALKKNLEILRKLKEQMESDYQLAQDQEIEDAPPPELPPPPTLGLAVQGTLQEPKPQFPTKLPMPGRQVIPLPSRAEIPKFKTPDPIMGHPPPPDPNRHIVGTPVGMAPSPYPAWTNDPPKDDFDPYNGDQGDPQNGKTPAQRQADLKARAQNVKLLLALAQNPSLGIQVLLEMGQADQPPPILPLALLVDLQKVATPHTGSPGPVALDKLSTAKKSLDPAASADARVLGGLRSRASFEFFAAFAPDGAISRREIMPLKPAP